MTNKRQYLVLGLLRLLRSRYPDLVEERELCEYNDVLTEPLGIIAPAPKTTKKGNQSSDIDYLSKVAMIRSTNFIELYKGVLNSDPQKNIPNKYKITLKGIEFLSQIELQKSSERLENLTYTLFVITGLLAIFAFAQIIITTQSNIPEIQNALVISAFVIVGAFVVVLIIFSLIKRQNNRISQG